MFKNIVVGLDGSKESEAGLRVACEISKKFDADIHLVHTPQPQTVAFALGAVSGYHTVTTMPPEEDITLAAEKLVSKANDIANEFDLTIAHTRVNRGSPVDEIIACANGCGADLIVTGRRGLGSLGALVQGSTSLGISHKADCAVLSVI